LSGAPPDAASLDVVLLHALYVGSWSPAWLAIALAVTFLGSGWMMIGLLPGMATPRLRAPAIAAALTLTATSALVSLVKMLASRARPCHAMPWCHTLPIDVPVDPSFPSGHAAGSFAFAAFVSRLDGRLAWLLFPLASLVALSRVALGMHYPTDVLAGAVLGTLVGSMGARAYERRLGSS
jgi:undecaprenyl-diphosphatase